MVSAGKVPSPVASAPAFAGFSSSITATSSPAIVTPGVSGQRAVTSGVSARICRLFTSITATSSPAIVTPGVSGQSAVTSGVSARICRLFILHYSDVVACDCDSRCERAKCRHKWRQRPHLQAFHPSITATSSPAIVTPGVSGQSAVTSGVSARICRLFILHYSDVVACNCDSRCERAKCRHKWRQRPHLQAFHPPITATSSPAIVTPGVSGQSAVTSGVSARICRLFILPLQRRRRLRL